ncbi:hypothetical protein TNCV_2935651 [Trichonephila clavipes]|nr:hypothetical protein TNCV_2935651 [Trichonephila clavipes]
MFADDTAILATHTEPKLIARALNRHILDLEDWFSKWKIALNVESSDDRTDTGRLQSRSQRRYPFGDRNPSISATPNQRAPSRNARKEPGHR